MRGARRVFGLTWLSPIAQQRSPLGSCVIKSEGAMSMHEIEDLVEWAVRLLAASAPARGLDLRALFWNLYDYQSRFDTGNTLFRVAPILVKHRYLYAFPLHSHPDFA